MAKVGGLSPAAFRTAHTELGGIRLQFNGRHRWKGLAACSQYDPAVGCMVHAGRPLACRLYPLGRERQAEAVRYLYQGKKFPCLEGCPSVVNLPRMTVAEYLEGQGIQAGEQAQDAYLEVVQDLAEGAFVLLLETGLSASGDRETLRRWRQLGRSIPEVRARAIPDDWLERLVLPGQDSQLEDPAAFVKAHHGRLQADAQAAFGALSSLEQVRDACCLMFTLALHLAQSLGTETGALAALWIQTAKDNGARE